MEEKSEKLYYLEGTIESFKEKDALVVLKDGQKVFWPIKNLPDDAAAGNEVRLVLSTAKTEQTEREKLAKTILNEILKNK